MAEKKPIRIDAEDPEAVVIYTDGSCYPNPNGQGGWAFFCTRKGQNAIRYGYSPCATNNLMELTAILHALLYVPAGKRYRYPLIIFTDSQYCKNAILEWVHGWEKSNWTTAAGQPVKNKEIIQHIHALMQKHKAHREVELRWVRGHVGIPENELVDQRANFGRKQRSTNWTAHDQKN